MDEAHYSDANMTMRLSYGFIQDYTANGTHYNYFTNSQSLLDKAAKEEEIDDYELEADIVVKKAIDLVKANAEIKEVAKKTEAKKPAAKKTTAKAEGEKKPAAKKSAASTAKKPTVKKPAAAKAAPQKAASAPKTEKAETVFSVGDALPYYLL